MKTTVILLLQFLLLNAYGQRREVLNEFQIQEKSDELASVEQGLEFERPMNIFLAGGANLNLIKTYDVTISPIDRTVQFQNLGLWKAFLSTGLVWNPFKNLLPGKKYLYDESNKKFINIQREKLAVALLIDVFQLSFNQDDVKAKTPFDVGFGLGWRSEELLILGTVEFSYTKQPRDYFYNKFKDGNQTLILPGANEPTLAIDEGNSGIFYSKLIPSLGLKIAYTFLKK